MIGLDEHQNYKFAFSFSFFFLLIFFTENIFYFTKFFSIFLWIFCTFFWIISYLKNAKKWSQHLCSQQSTDLGWSFDQTVVDHPSRSKGWRKRGSNESKMDPCADLGSGQTKRADPPLVERRRFESLYKASFISFFSFFSFFLRERGSQFSL